MTQVNFDPAVLKNLQSKTAIITGGAGGIGAATARIFNQHGANVVIADIPALKEKADSLIDSFPDPSRACYLPVDILNWVMMCNLFKSTVQKFGEINIVVANAGITESVDALDVNTVDGNGNLLESKNAFRVIDVNVKGTMNSM